MTSNLSNLSSTCALSTSDQTFGDISRLITSTVITPVFFLVGVSGRLLSLLSLHFETRSTGAYLYQSFVLFSDCLEIVFFTLFVLVYYLWCFSGSLRARWFRRCYACMWYAAYAADPLSNVAMSSTLLLQLAMTTDRICSLARPFVYRRLPHRRIQWTVFLVCNLVAISTSIVFVPLFDIESSDDGMFVMVQSRFARSPVRLGLTKVHNVFKVGSAVLLFASNFVLFYVYRWRMKERARIRESSTDGPRFVGRTATIVEARPTDADRRTAIQDGRPTAADRRTLEDEAKNDRSSKTLFKLTLCQSIFGTIGVFANITYHMFEVASLEFVGCWGDVIASFVDGIMELSDICQFFVMLAISKRFRGMVTRTLAKCWTRKRKGGKVMDSNNTAGQDMSMRAMKSGEQ